MNRVNEWFANVVAQLACLYSEEQKKAVAERFKEARKEKK